MKRFGIVVAVVVLVGASWAGAVNWGKGKRVLKKGLANVPTTRKPSKSGKNSLRVVGLSIALPDPNSRSGQSLAGHRMAGTEINFLLARKDRFFVRMDEKASKITMLVDDKGKKLSRKKKRWGHSDFGAFPKIGADGRTLRFSVTTDKTPTPGASRVHVKGNVLIHCGAKEKTASQKNVAFRKGTRIFVGPLAGTITQAGKPKKRGGGSFAGWVSEKSKFAVAIKSTGDAFSKVKTLTFVGADGKVLKSKRTSTMTMGDVVEREYGFEKKIRTATIEVTYYGKMAKLAIPIDHKVSVGLR